MFKWVCFKGTFACGRACIKTFLGHVRKWLSRKNAGWCYSQHIDILFHPSCIAWTSADQWRIKVSVFTHPLFCSGSGMSCWQTCHVAKINKACIAVDCATSSQLHAQECRCSRYTGIYRKFSKIVQIISNKFCFEILIEHHLIVGRAKVVI